MLSSAKWSVHWLRHNSSKKDLKTLEREREAKIARFKQQKERESRLQELLPLVEKDHVDEDVKVSNIETQAASMLSVGSIYSHNTAR